MLPRLSVETAKHQPDFTTFSSPKIPPSCHLLNLRRPSCGIPKTQGCQTLSFSFFVVCCCYYKSSLKNRSICVFIINRRALRKHNCWAELIIGGATETVMKARRGAGEGGGGGVSISRRGDRVKCGREGEYMLMLNEFGRSAAQWNLYP